MAEIQIDIPAKMVQPLFAPHRYKIFKGGRGCVAADTEIAAINGPVKVQNFKGGLIWVVGEAGPTVSWAGPAVEYPPEVLFNVILETGQSIKVTSAHRFLTPQGWKPLFSLLVGCSLIQPSGLLPGLPAIFYGESPSKSPEDDLHLIQKSLGFLYCCSTDPRLCDEPPHGVQETYQGALQRLAGALQHKNRASMHGDGLGSEDMRGLRQSFAHLPNHSAPPSMVGRNYGAREIGSVGISSGLPLVLSRVVQLSQQKSILPEQVRAFASQVLAYGNHPEQGGTLQILHNMLLLAVDDSSYSDYLHLNCNHNHHLKQGVIAKIEEIGERPFYDLFVPIFNNYLASGMVHHNSAKSWGVARGLLAYAKTYPKRIFCGRETQKSIEDSSYRLLKDQITLLGLASSFEVLSTKIRGANGSEFIFRGLSNLTAESIKSMEGIDIFWGEEAHTFSHRSLELLIPTIRKDGSELWFTYNPDEETDPVDVRFTQKPPPDCIVTEMNWEDNPWFPEVLRKEKDYLYSVDPETAAHVWGGQYRKVSDAQILRGRYSVREFTPVPGLWDGPYHGIDFGFSQDPGTMVRVWIWEGDLYLEYEAFGLEVDTDDLPALWDDIPGAKDYVARADCARPETISGVKRLGYQRVLPCKKWKGCEEDGITHLRSYKKIVIHPRCPNAVEEAKNWCWKKDRLTGDILRVTTGKFDNTWAAVRYALEPIILHGLATRTPPEEPEDLETMLLRRRGGVSEHSWMG